MKDLKKLFQIHPSLFAMRKLLFIILWVSGVEASFAQGPPIFTDTPIMLGLDGRGIRTFGRYINRENVKVYVQPVAIPYNINAKWQVGAILPWRRINPETEGLKANSGFGDITLFTKYQVFQKDGKGKTFRGLVKLSETIPSGNTSKAPAIGSGVNTTGIGFVTGYVTLKYGLYGEIGYNIVSDGSPNNLIYNLALSYPLLPQKYPPFQLNLSVDLNGSTVPEVDHNILFFSPGLQLITGKRFLLETGVQLPLSQSGYDGNKIKYTYTLGTRILIF